MRKNFFTNLLLLIFILTSSILFSSALGLIFKLSGSVKSLMNNAQTPDFMQMHSGEIDYERLNKFATENNFIKHHQVANMLNIDGVEIHFGNKNLSGNVMDNGFCVQNKLFDFLLDSNGNVINVKNGEIYVPLSYWNKYSLKQNDTTEVCGINFTVKGFLRDSQMNSDMASSKRFLISDSDYEKLKPFGKEEYLIEFIGEETTGNNHRQNAGKIENAYVQSGLENNGPAISYSLFYLINILSDGVMLALIILISILIVLISFLCIRFTLLATLEDDYQQIGVMKAIGFYHKEIVSIYLKKYSIISFIGCLIGFIFSFPLKSYFIYQTNIYVARQSNDFLSSTMSLFGSAVLFLSIQLYVKSVLKKIKKISAAKAVREGRDTEMEESGKSLSLSKSRIISRICGTNIFLGIQDVLKRKKMYSTLLLVLVLSVFIMIVPQNLYQTIKDSSFMSYMGVSKCNVRIDLQQLSNLDEKSRAVEKWISSDKDVDYYNLYITRSVKMKCDDNSIENLKVETGDYSNNTIDYIEGRAPLFSDEIALSYLEAAELGKKIGDTILICSNNTADPLKDDDIQESVSDLKICGIYSDVTNGGKTAKMISTGEYNNSDNVMWHVFCVQYKSNALSKFDEYKSIFNYGKFTQIEEYIKQTVGSTINSISLVSKISLLLAIGIAVLITSLFLKLLIAKDSYNISILHSIGFSKNDIKIQYITRTVFVLFISIVLGTVLSNTLGITISRATLSNLGIANFHFVIKPMIVYLALPLLLLIVVAATSLLSVKISDNKE